MRYNNHRLKLLFVVLALWISNVAVLIIASLLFQVKSSFQYHVHPSMEQLLILDSETFLPEKGGRFQVPHYIEYADALLLLVNKDQEDPKGKIQLSSCGNSSDSTKIITIDLSKSKKNANPSSENSPHSSLFEITVDSEGRDLAEVFTSGSFWLVSGMEQISSDWALYLSYTQMTVPKNWDESTWMRLWARSFSPNGDVSE